MIAIKDYIPKRPDFLLLGLAVLMSVFGILLVFDASYAYLLARHLSEYKYVVLQAAWGAAGILVMLGVMHVPYWKWRGVVSVSAWIVMIALALVLIPHVGVEVNGSARWLGRGAWRFQPSELAKLVMVLYIAKSCAGRSKLHFNMWSPPLKALLVIGAYVLLTAREPDLGTAIVLLATGMISLYIGGVGVRRIVAAGAAILAVSATLLAASALLGHGHNGMRYWGDRIGVFLHPDLYRDSEGYQIFHSKVALGTGGVFGVGIGEGREKMYLPEAHTDFVFSVLGEEGGLVAGLAVLLLYTLIVGRGMHIACTTKDPYGSLIAAGFSSCIGLQALMNIAVATGAMPATGVPLPWLSYGGSSLMLTLTMVGVLLSIARHPGGDPAKLEETKVKSQEKSFDSRWEKPQIAASTPFIYRPPMPAPRRTPSTHGAGRR